MATSPDPTRDAPGGLRIKGFLAGTLSGLTKLVVGHPFDTIKLRLQVLTPSPFTGPLDCLLQTISKEGPRALYKGASPPAVGWALSDAVLLGSLHNYRLGIAQWEARRAGELGRKEEGEEFAKLSLGGHALAGLLAGWTVCTITTPIELLKAKLQIQLHSPTSSSSPPTSKPPSSNLYTGPISILRQILSHSGPTGLYHGFLSNVLFRSWFGANFASYHLIMTHFRTSTDFSPGLSNFLAGGLASNVFWIGSFPFDAVKNRLMADSVLEPKYAGWRDAARSIWVEGGPKAFYRGFVPCILRAFPTNASAIFVWETSMRMMGAERVGG